MWSESTNRYIEYRKFERVLALTMACAFFLTGCGILAIESTGSTAPSEELSGSIESILSGIGAIEDLSFEVNRSAATEIEYVGTETSVMVVDEKGLTWELTIPENALRDPCTITLTPLKDIEGEHKKEGLSGILMEPDGLTFTKPATLTVTGSDADKLLFLSGTQDGKNYTYQSAEKLDNGVKLSVNHFSSEVASDVFSDPEAYKAIKETLSALEKGVKSTLSKSIKVPDVMEIQLECYEGVPKVVIKQIVEWVLPEATNVLWAGMAMNFGEQHDDKILVNKARRLWLDSIKRFLEKEKAYYDKYKAQPDKFIIVPYTFSDIIDFIIISGGEEPPADVVAMYYDFVGRKEKWAHEGAKHSIKEIREHNYKYAAYAIKCMEYIDYDKRREMWEDLEKALTFKLKIKVVYTQMYGDSGPGIITSEGEGKMIPQWNGNKMLLSGDINIQTTTSGFYKDFINSPAGYKISAQVKNWDPCKTQSCDIWVSTLGLEEETLGYGTGSDYVLFSEAVIWCIALDHFETELQEGFSSKLHNLEEKAVEESLSGKDDLFDMTLDVFFDLIHTPQ